MDERSRQTSSDTDRTGVTVIGARVAGDVVSASSSSESGPRKAQWSDSAESDAEQLHLSAEAELSDDSDSFDPGWMVAGDATLGDLLGVIPPGGSEALAQAQLSAREAALQDLAAADQSRPVTPAVLSPVADAALNIDLTDDVAAVVVDDRADDDVFPEEMYDSVPGFEEGEVDSEADSDSAAKSGATNESIDAHESFKNVAAVSDELSSDELSSDELSSDELSSDELSSDELSSEDLSEQAERRRNEADRRLLDRREEMGAVSAPAPTRRKAAAAPPDEDSEEWTAFAGSAPRWRDEASDWADVDAEDPSQLGDDKTMVGTLNPLRSERSDLYGENDGDEFDDSDEASVDSGGSNRAKVLSFDGLAENREVKGRSGGSQQRDGVRVSRAVAGADGSPATTQAGQSVTVPFSGQGQGQGPTQNRAKSSAQAGGDSADRPRQRPTKAAPASSLGARVGTALSLVIVCAVVCIFLKENGAAVLIALAIPMASLELMQALKSRGFKPAIPPVALGLMGTVGAAMWRGERGVMIVSVVTVVSVLLWFLFGAERERPAVNVAASLMAFGYLGTAAATGALLLNAPKGLGLLVGAIVCTIVHDVFAYFGGRAIGKHKLAPDISPNKTVEGLVAGVLGAVIAGVVFARLGWTWTGTAQGIALGFVVGLAAPLGDLVESQLKRDLRIKDSGTLLPGHGGVLDRIDAMLLAVPAAWLVAIAFGHL
jgi:CDP-diglyceride synthetase